MCEKSRIMMGMRTLYTYFKQLLLLIFVCICLGLISVPSVNAQAIFSGPVPLEGYAWSETIGWIHFDHGQPNAVQVNANADNTVTGYAWSENIGWIRFGLPATAVFPVGGGTTPENARLVQVSPGIYELRGWARACAGTQSNLGSCNNMNSRTDGWDGWIALSGANHTIRFAPIAAVDNDPLGHSFAWGSDVVGWVDFAPPFGGVRLGANPQIKSFSFTPGNLASDGTATVLVNYDVEFADTCELTHNQTGGTVPVPLPSPIPLGPQTFTLTPSTGNMYTYTLTCRNGARTTTATAPLEVRPDIVIGTHGILPAGTLVATAGGVLPNFSYNAQVAGMPSGVSAPYVLTLTDELGVISQTRTGSISGPGAVISESFTALPYGGDLSVTLEVDLPAAGTVLENRVGTPGINEDIVGNSISGSPASVITVIPPQITINYFRVVGGQQVIRNGSTVALEWSVDAPYSVTCEVDGPGISTTFTHTVPALPVPPLFPNPTLGNALSDARFNASVYTLSCQSVDTTVINTTTQRQLQVDVASRVEEL